MFRLRAAMALSVTRGDQAPNYWHPSGIPLQRLHRDAIHRRLYR
jgi:hypothetical protein